MNFTILIFLSFSQVPISEKSEKMRELDRISLRLDEDLHQRLLKVAESLGIGFNDLLNYAIRRSLGSFQVQAALDRRNFTIRRGKQATAGKRQSVTLRTIPELSATLHAISTNYYRGVNGLMAEMFLHSLGLLETEARIYDDYVRTGEYVARFLVWEQQNPGKSVKEFLDEFEHEIREQSRL